MAATTMAAIGSWWAGASAATLATVGSAAVTVGSTVAANKAQGRAARLQQRQADLQARRQRRQAIRSAQVQRARAQSQASAAGATTSSAMGGIGSISSQLGSGLGYASQQTALGSGIMAANQQAANWGAVGQLAGTGMNLGIQMGGLNGMFGGSAPTPAPKNYTL